MVLKFFFSEIGDIVKFHFTDIHSPKFCNWGGLENPLSTLCVAA